MSPAENGKSGLLFVKENINNDGKTVIDRQDNSVMRSEKGFEAIFSEAHLRIVQKTYQKGMPRELNRIACWVLAANCE